MMSTKVEEKTITKLLETTKEACDVLSVLVQSFYTVINGNDDTLHLAKLKGDKSVFTIADGIVQELLQRYLFSGEKFADIIGEEDNSVINISSPPYTVDELVVPDVFNSMIESTVRRVSALGQKIDSDTYKSLTIFIDPIDGTREFSSGKGEECTICIGFATDGKSEAGCVYRPISYKGESGIKSWAYGCPSENTFECKLSEHPKLDAKDKLGFLTTNGNISSFTAALIKELGYQQVCSGGVGNKMLMLLEGRGHLYLQDRGVSRWDTCGAEAVLKARGGTLSQLEPFLSTGETKHYTYKKSSSNLDFKANVSYLSKYNVVDPKSFVAKVNTLASSVEQVKPYSNLLGLVAQVDGGNDTKILQEKMKKVSVLYKPVYN